MRNLILLIFLFIGSAISAQNQTSHWYFGSKAAMNFNAGVRTILNDSQMAAPYGSASISDKQGNLLFYTNGQSIWNKNHQIMNNGEGLKGDPTNTQTSIIIPKPNSDTDYFVFTTSKTDGIQYSTVRISSGNPLGEVISKNIRLTTRSSERITAIHHANGKDFWVVGMVKKNINNEFRTIMAFKVDENIVSLLPVESDGPELPSENGEMKFSPNGKKIAITTGDTIFFMYNFDSNTGDADLDYEANMAINLSEGYVPHGVTFTQDSKVMFVSVQYYPNTQFALLQVDLTKPFDPLNTPAFGAPVLRSNGYQPGSLQVALDGSIYVALNKSNSADAIEIGVIDNPNEIVDESSFRMRQLSLDTGRSTKGLPNFIQSYFATRIITENQCFVDPFSFTAASFATITNVEWDFGDGSTGSGLNVTHTYSTPGTYTIKAKITINGSDVDVFKVVEAYALPIVRPNQELVECDDDLDGISIFNLFSIQDKISNPNFGLTFGFYKTQTDAEQNRNKITNPENYTNTNPTETIFVRVTNENNCFDIGSFQIRSNFAQLGVVPDYYTCEFENSEGTFDSSTLLNFIRNNLNISPTTELKLHPTYVDAQTNTNEFPSKFRSKSTTVYIKGFGQNDECVGITSMNLTVNPLPEIPLLDEYTICFDPSLQTPVVLELDNTFDTYRWKNSNGVILGTSSKFTLHRTGNYTIEVSKTQNGITCSNTKSFTVVNPPKPSFGAIDVNTENESNNMIQVEVIGNSSYSFSLDNINFFGSGSNHVFSQVTPGIRTIYVKDQNNCEEPISIKVSVIGFKSFFSPNGDGKNEFWNITGLDSNSFKSVNVLIYNRYGTIVGSITDFSSYGWDGTFNGKPQISSTYWYTAVLVDNDDEVIKKTGNFSLVRE